MNEIIALRQADGSFLIGMDVDATFVLQAFNDFDNIDNFLVEKKGEYIFSLLSYQLGFPLLSLDYPSKTTNFPLAQFWTCKYVCRYENNAVYWLKGEPNPVHHEKVMELFGKSFETEPNWEFKPIISKETYLKQLKTVRNHLQQGNIYELNFCQAFKAKSTSEIDTQAVFARLYKENPTPHAAFIDFPTWSLASASPERFIKKQDLHISSDPIKGTARRGSSPDEDEKIKQELRESRKERAENVMIVDLVRNDLSKIANKGSVRVNELFGIYTYPTVHQMISSISCTVPATMTFTGELRALFPMGSMTGAPKRSAVEIAGSLEAFNRELYSGSLGVIQPNGDYDFNVLIRTLTVDKTTSEISCAVGGAITILSEPEAEYDECKVKINKIISLFGTCTWS